jgi:hypothetical protein
VPCDPGGNGILGRLQARLLGFRHPAIVCAVVGACFVGGIAVAYRYVTELTLGRRRAIVPTMANAA